MIEKVYIQQFLIYSDKTIYVRKITEIVRAEMIIASSAWSIILQINDPQAEMVLGDEPDYLTLARQAWK